MQLELFRQLEKKLHCLKLAIRFIMLETLPNKEAMPNIRLLMKELWGENQNH
ncbi:hypothetical protein D3C86_2188230 [compost metagenome]